MCDTSGCGEFRRSSGVRGEVHEREMPAVRELLFSVWMKAGPSAGFQLYSFLKTLDRLGVMVSEKRLSLDSICAWLKSPAITIA